MLSYMFCIVHHLFILAFLQDEWNCLSFSGEEIKDNGLELGMREVVL